MLYPHKALKLSQAARGKTTVGQLVNLLSNDVNRFDFSLMWIPFLAAGPLQTVIFTYLLYAELGWPVFPAIGLVVVFAVLQCMTN